MQTTFWKDTRHIRGLGEGNLKHVNGDRADWQVGAATLGQILEISTTSSFVYQSWAFVKMVATYSGSMLLTGDKVTT